MKLASIALLADAWDVNGHMGGGWWVVMMIGMVVFWAAVIVGIAWLVRGGPSESRGRASGETPLEVLDRRFAEGAMSSDDYRERKDVLTGVAGSSGGPDVRAR
jgi:putative membrane protein